MSSPTVKMPSRRTSEDKAASWKDQLSPRLMGFRGFSRRASDSAKMKDQDRKFTMMHFPDRPARRITEAEIPSEEECKAFLISMRKASFAEQLQRQKEEQKQQQQQSQPGQDLRRTFGPLTPAQEEENPWELRSRDSAAEAQETQLKPPPPSFRSTFGPLTPAAEEEDIDPLDTAGSAPAAPAPPPSSSLLQVPEAPPAEARSSAVTEDGFMMISEAKQVKLERVDISPDASPTSSPRKGSMAQEWPKRKQSVQCVVIPTPRRPSVAPEWQRRKQSVQTVLIRRPSRAQDALSSHPVHVPGIPVHVRQDSASDPLCRVCHGGLAEKSGVCSRCEDEYSAPTTPVDAHPHPIPRHQQKLPQPLNLNKPTRPLIPHTLDGIASLHRPSASLTSDPEANQPSPPPSPMSPCRAVHHPASSIVAAMPTTPLTPLSELSTPEVFKRFQLEMDRKTQAEEVVPPPTVESDVYDDEWADYYFDKQNFKTGKRREPPKLMPLGEVHPFMQRELSLDEYDGAFGNPASPGGWI